MSEDDRSNAKRGSAPRAVIWTVAAKQAERLLGIVSISILARALSPADFGLVAMAGSVVAIIEVMSYFGFDWSLLRLSDATRAHYNTAWTLRVLTGASVALLILLAAYPASLYFHRPAVAWVIVAMGLTTLLGSFDNIWMAEFRRNTQFEPEFRLRIAAKIAGFIASVGIAITTHSYWALVAGLSVSSLTSVLMSYRLHRSRPSWDLSRHAELLQFSVWLIGTNILETLRTRVADIWIGRHLGSNQVGHYALASEISALASSELVAPINRVVFSNYAQLQSDTNALREAYLRVSGIIWLVAFPATVGIWTCARQIVAVLLGPQWGDTALVLQVLAAAGLLKVIAGNTYYVYLALGRAAFATGLSFLGVAVFVSLTFILGPRYGLMGVAWAQVLSSALIVLINLVVLFHTLRLPAMEFVARNYRVVFASLTMGVLVSVMQDWLDANLHLPHVLTLSAMILAGVLSYALALFALWRFTGKSAGSEAEVLALARRWMSSFLERRRLAAAP